MSYYIAITKVTYKCFLEWFFPIMIIFTQPLVTKYILNGIRHKSMLFFTAGYSIFKIPTYVGTVKFYIHCCKYKENFLHYDSFFSIFAGRYLFLLFLSFLLEGIFFFFFFIALMTEKILTQNLSLQKWVNPLKRKIYYLAQTLLPKIRF